MAETTLRFRALLLANEQRNAYGLRYNDLQRYRKHCANRTHRLRSSLKMTHGKGREFKKLPPVTADNISDGYLQLLLFEAERAWAYSRELHAQAMNPANDDKASALKRNATSRFRRAVNWATQLLSHSQSLYALGRLPAQGLIEATIYTLILNGRFLNSRFDYEDALIQLSVARSLLDELASRATTSRDQALYTAFADEIGPEIRYAAHELGNPKAYDVDAIAADISSKHKNEIVEGYDFLVQKLIEQSAGGADTERKKLNPIVWEGEPVPIRNPELVDVLLRVQEAEQKLKDSASEKQNADQQTKETKKKGKVGKGARSKKGVAAYDAILLALSEAEDVARKLVESQQLNTSTAPAGTRDMQFVHAYIVYQLLARRIQRDLLLISTLIHQSQASSHRHQAQQQKATKTNPAAGPSKPRREQQVDARLFPAIVKLLDTILQSLNQMRTLSIIEDSPDLASAVDARVSYTKARRCRYLARCYTPVKKYAEALSLTQYGTLHLRETRSLLTLLPSPDSDPINAGAEPAFYPLSASDIDQLESEIEGDSLQYKKDWFSLNGGAPTSPSSDDSGKLKTHKKPLFFDIALNYVQLDMKRLQERAGKKIEATSSQQAALSTAAASTTTTRGISSEEKSKPTKSAKVEAIERPETPEPADNAAGTASRGGLSSLLGGWWGRK
ncbi:hypothetical protein K474DRAFT_725051 [Panus rudis PR-1116 ss-1]|nr:hypothetical protein K474DRAFT_725051 [Panus rudis PR-1116 ss-1]